MSGAERYVVLFTDCLLIAKYGVMKSKKAQVSKIYALNAIEKVELVSEQTAKSAFSLYIYDRKEPYIFECATDRERKTWIDCFKSTIADAKDCIPPSLKGSSSLTIRIIENKVEQMKPASMTWTSANLEAARQMMKDQQVPPKLSGSTSAGTLASIAPELKRSVSLTKVESIGDAAKTEIIPPRVRKSSEDVHVTFSDNRLSIQSIAQQPETPTTPSSASSSMRGRPPVPGRHSPSSTSLSSPAGGTIVLSNSTSKPAPPIPPKKPVVKDSIPSNSSVRNSNDNISASKASENATSPPTTIEPTTTTTSKTPPLGGGGSRVRELAALYGSTLSSALPSRIEKSDVHMSQPLVAKGRGIISDSRPVSEAPSQNSMPGGRPVSKTPNALQVETQQNTTLNKQQNGPAPPLLPPSPVSLKAQQDILLHPVFTSSGNDSSNMSLGHTLAANVISPSASLSSVKPAQSASAAAKSIQPPRGQRPT